MSEVTQAYLKEATIKRADQLTERPTISLFVMAKNAESCIGRLLENVGPHVDELVLVLNDTEDSTEEICRAHCESHDLLFKVVPVTTESHPELYILDTKATYEIGRSLAGEAFAGPYMETLILADWAAARNLGWDQCAGDWRLFLDADDVVEDPESIPGLCALLTAEGVEQACTKYTYHVDDVGRPKGTSYRERLAVNEHGIKWIFPIHEVLAGARRIAHIDGNLRVRDMRDNKGKAVRIPGRNFKILYHQARSRDWEVSPRTIVNLIVEARDMAGQPGIVEFAEALLSKHQALSEWPEERGWACAMLGEMYEVIERFDDAIKLYQQSLVEHPGSKAAFRLCRAHFTMEHWQECIDAFHMGVENRAVHQVLDDGPAFEDMSKILVASAYNDLGEKDKATRYVEEALKAFPTNSALLALRDKISLGGSDE